MKIAWIGGDHPRHLFYYNKVQQNHKPFGAIVEIREQLIPEPPSGILARDKHNVIHHFNQRKKCEEKYFGTQPFPTCNVLKTDTKNLSSSNS